MSAKRALIVDDSNSARIVLSRMLQKYSIDVDTAESAESAMVYLTHNRPDVIFMDHLMPGMDGFQAVQAIKNNPRTATIPIMMYTSQEGELYVGQARALGAVGVLPKLVKPVDVSKVLYQLHLLPERRDLTPPAFVSVNPLAMPSPQAADLVPADWHPQLEAALRNHDAELRRFVVATLDSFADRITSDVRHWIGESTSQEAPPAPAQAPPYWWIAGVLAALLAGAVSTGLYLRTLATNRALATENTQLQQTNSQLALATQRITAMQAAQADSGAMQAGTSALAAVAAPASSSEWRVEPVPYGEPPLALGRVDALREFLARLDQQSFTGVVKATAYRGRFCLSGNATEGYALASEELAAAKCDLIGNPFDGASNSAQRQSLAFANLASSVRLRTNGAISVIVNDEPADARVVAPYPSAIEGVTAGQWNEIAARNNRVELTTAPKPSSP